MLHLGMNRHLGRKALGFRQTPSPGETPELKIWLPRKKVVIPDERSEIRNPGPFKPPMRWIPDRVRMTAKNKSKKRCDLALKGENMDPYLLEN